MVVDRQGELEFGRETVVITVGEVESVSVLDDESHMPGLIRLFVKNIREPSWFRCKGTVYILLSVKGTFRCITVNKKKTHYVHKSITQTDTFDPQSAAIMIPLICHHGDVSRPLR